MTIRRKLATTLIALIAAAGVLVPSAAAEAFLSSTAKDLSPLVRALAKPGAESLACLKQGAASPAIHTTIPVDRTTGKDSRSLAKVVDFDMNGLTTVEIVPVGSRPYVFGYRSCDGVGFVRLLNENGTLGGAGAAFDWTTGWTSIEPYQVGTQTFVLQVKSGDGTVAISRVAADAAGPVTITETDRDNWTSGWTHAKPFTVAAGQFALLYKKGTGEVAWRRLTSNGKYVRGEALPRTNFGPGWTQMETYQAGTKTYLLLSNRSTGSIMTVELTAFGAIGASPYSDAWTSGWDSAHVFDAGSSKYVVMSKSNGDRVMVRRVEAGAITVATMDFPWDHQKIVAAFDGRAIVPDYQHINFTRGYSVGTKTYVLTVASARTNDLLF